MSAKYIDTVIARRKNNLWKCCRELDDDTLLDRPNWAYLRVARPVTRPNSLNLGKLVNACEASNTNEYWTALAHAEVGSYLNMKRVRGGEEMAPEVLKAIIKEQLDLQDDRNKRKQTELGRVGDCGCCYETVPLNRMVHCAEDKTHVGFRLDSHQTQLTITAVLPRLREATGRDHAGPRKVHAYLPLDGRLLSAVSCRPAAAIP